MPRVMGQQALQVEREDPPLTTTLLDLVCAVGETTDDDDEVVATVRHLIRTGQVILCGNFRGVPAALLLD